MPSTSPLASAISSSAIHEYLLQHPIVVTVTDRDHGAYALAAGRTSYALARARLSSDARIYVVVAPPERWAGLREEVDRLVTPLMASVRTDDLVRRWSRLRDQNRPSGLLLDQRVLTHRDVIRFLGVSRSTYYQILRSDRRDEIDDHGGNPGG